MFRKRIFQLLGLALLAFSLFGCSGSSSSSSSTTSDIQTGTFIDSAVENLSYKTATQSGTTDAKGQFKFKTGEKVTFSIGKTSFPEVDASSIVTPIDVSGDKTTFNNTATNIAVLLQSLDSDGDPTNGIKIATQASSSSVSGLDFTVSPSVFKANSQIINWIANSGSSNTTVISAETAIDHLKSGIGSASPITGAWQNAANNSFLTIFDDGTFLYAENDGEGDGAQTGTYTYTSSVFKTTVKFDTNQTNDGGLGNVGDARNNKAVLSNNNNKLDLLDGKLVMTKSDLSGSSIPGMWRNTSKSTYLTLYKDGHFVYLEPDGLQLGTYTYDSGSSSITFKVVFNDDTKGGGVGPIGTHIFTSTALSENNRVLTVGGSSGLTFNRSF